jgi:hypothetical protein
MVELRGVLVAPARVSVSEKLPDPTEPVPLHAQVRAAPLIVSPPGNPVAVTVEPLVAPSMVPLEDTAAGDAAATAALKAEGGAKAHQSTASTVAVVLGREHAADLDKVEYLPRCHREDDRADRDCRRRSKLPSTARMARLPVTVTNNALGMTSAGRWRRRASPA